jgi:hypothetical protein
MSTDVEIRIQFQMKYSDIGNFIHYRILLDVQIFKKVPICQLYTIKEGIPNLFQQG